MQIFNKNIEYRISSIVPENVALKHIESLERDEKDIFSEDFHNRVVSSKLWSNERTSLEGSRFGIGYKLMIEGAFGDWVVEKHPHGVATIIYAWNTSTKERIYLNDFELYIIESEYMIHRINSYELNISENANYKKLEDGSIEKYIDGKLVKTIAPLRIDYQNI